MGRKLAFVMILIVIFTRILGFASRIQGVEGGGTIYIRAEGSVDPPVAPIQRDGDVYTFTNDINGSIVVERDNIIVDGAGYMLQGPGVFGPEGIDLTDRSNVTVKNVEVTEFCCGIYLESSFNNTLLSNKITAIGGPAIWFSDLNESSYNVIVGNNITNNYFGVLLASSSNNNISYNCITANEDGICLGSRCSYNILSCNNITGNKFHGICVHEASSNIIRNNRIVYNELGIAFTYPSSNNTVCCNNIANNREDIRFSFWCSDNIFCHNNFLGNNMVTGFHRGPNFWDNGYPSGGNYWSSHNSPDADKDRIGDIPYTIDVQNVDRYPLVYPYGFVPTPDLNSDGTVNISDLFIIAKAWQTQPGDYRWNPTADMNTNEVINIVDIHKVAFYFGKTIL